MTAVHYPAARRDCVIRTGAGVPFPSLPVAAAVAKKNVDDLRARRRGLPRGGHRASLRVWESMKMSMKMKMRIAATHSIGQEDLHYKGIFSLVLALGVLCFSFSSIACPLLPLIPSHANRFAATGTTTRIF